MEPCTLPGCEVCAANGVSPKAASVPPAVPRCVYWPGLPHGPCGAPAIGEDCQGPCCAEHICEGRCGKRRLYGEPAAPAPPPVPLSVADREAIARSAGVLRALAGAWRRQADAAPATEQSPLLRRSISAESVARDVERLLASLGAERRWAPDGPGDVRVEAALVEAVVASFKSDLSALAAELRSALIDQRDHGASMSEVAKRVRAVADLLDPQEAHRAAP